MTTRKTYTKEFKEQAVQLAQRNGFAQTGRDLEVHPSLLHKWNNRLQDDGPQAFPGKGHARDEDLAALQRENARLREEVAILKKAVGIFSKRPG